MENLIGKYEHLKSNDLDEYLIGLGVGLVLRKVHSASKPDLEISYSDTTQQWMIRLESVFHRHVLKAKLGEEVEDETFDVRQCKTILQKDGSKLLMIQKCEEGPDVQTVFEVVEEGNVIIQMTSAEFKASQLFQPVPSLEVEGEEEEE